MMESGAWNKMANRVCELLKQGKVALGGWEGLNSTAAAEIMAKAGFDWVAADVEHATHSIQDYAYLAKAVKCQGCVPLARVFDKNPASIRRILDAGAQGVIVPMIRNADDAREVVAAAKFPPLGKRGVGGAPYCCYGLELGGDMARFNEEILVMVMVEQKEAVENIDEIMAVEGIDGIFLGPVDLSYSYGFGGQITHPIIYEAMDRVRQACLKYGKAPGMHLLGGQKAIKEAIDRGFTFLALSTAANFIYNGSKQVIEDVRSIDVNQA